MRTRLFSIAAIAVLAAAGCDRGGQEANETPAFTLAWSEYPSWSVFGVAHQKGIINGERGKLGPVEEKWGVDIVLNEAEYDPCLTMYGTGTCDAVCITNMDVLNPALTRPSVAILPTSTSFGGDAVIAVGIDDIEGLKGHKVFGLEKSVSEYCFFRGLEKLGQDPSGYTFANMDPAAAAQALQTGQADVQAICVWNPFALQTLKTLKNAKVLFNSRALPGEIIDMVVVARQSLEKPGGPAFAHAVIDTYYRVNQLLEDPATRDETLVAIGAKFSNLNLEEMKQVVQQTVFYKTPAAGLEVFQAKKLEDTMNTVMKFCIARQIVSEEVPIGYGQSWKDPAFRLVFDPSFIEAVRDRKE